LLDSSLKTSEGFENNGEEWSNSEQKAQKLVERHSPHRYQDTQVD
jgi:hypothetical protein